MRALTIAAAFWLVGGCRAAPADGPAGSDTEDVTRSLLSTAEEERAVTREPPELLRAQQKPVDLEALGLDRGSENALVRVVEMSDYGCGYCRQFHLETWPVLARAFVESGKVEWKFLPFVNGMFPNSPHATSAAECALEQGTGPFEAVDVRLWKDQPAWKGSSEPAALIRGWVSEAGLDMTRFDSCISEGRRDARIAAANALSRQAGVRATPTFFVIGYPPLQGALPAETFTRVLDMVYEDASRRAGGGD
ncbi:MAG TPA: thioredoxin domain-containing protein [Longimicrobiales bacterium]|nr:thioredoxin domain-containing protein [Longimicrobiales bacterium]